MKRLTIILSIILNFGILTGQNISFTASAPRVVAVGEQFNLAYSVNAEGSNFTGPNLSQFNRLAGPSPSSSSSMQIINGSVTKSVTNSYTYVLSSNKEGKYTIPSAQINVNGKSYSSNQVIVEVVKGRSAFDNNSQAGNNDTPAGIKNDDVFVKTIVSKGDVYLGEHLVVTLKVYSRTNNIKFTDAKFPSFDGFLTDQIDNVPNNLFRENYNGEVYYAGIFKKIVLFPQRTGEITIEPFELQCQVSVQSGYRNDFFGRKVPGYKNMTVNIKSNTRKINVKDLVGNKPSDYTGAVGNFTMKATTDKSSVSTNDAISLKITISGSGNLKLIDPLNIKFPPDFEVYDPKVINNFKSGDDGVKGSKSFEYLIIPRYAGDYKIPAVKFTYFDTQSGSFKNLSSDDFNLHVEKGNDDQNTTIVSGFSKEDVKFIGKDIRYLKTGTGKLVRSSKVIFGSNMFWLTYLLSLVVFVSIIYFRRKMLKENANIALVKNKRASKIAKKRLKQAAIHLKSKEENKFYQEILSSVYGYLGDKLGIPAADMKKEYVINRLSGFKISESEIQHFNEFLSKCEFAQYAPGSISEGMDVIFSEAEKFIGLFENKLR